MSQPRIPDFIIVGAQKSGTTSLHHILDHHPDVYIPPEEIFFFDIDDIQQHYDFFIHFKNQRRWTRFNYDANFESYFQWYTKKFQDGRDHGCVGEDSTTYLASPKAPKRIAQLIPNAKIIVMLRDPVMRAYSHYWHLVESRRAVYNFEETLQYQPENVISRGYYQAQIERYHQHFPAEQIKVIIFEHFIKNQQAVIDDVCAFLGLDGSVDTDSVPTWSNKTTVPRVLSLQLLYNRLLRPITNKRFFIRKDLPGGDNRTSDSAGVSSGTSGLMTQLAKVDRFIVDLNAGKRPPIRPETRDFLQAHYAHENRDLSELIGADVGEYWSYMPPENA